MRGFSIAPYRGTHTGDILGTVRYMSPERFQGKCDVRADVYSLGLTLYEMLVLKPAFASSDQMKLGLQRSSSRPVDSRSVPHVGLPIEISEAAAISATIRASGELAR